MKSRIMYWLVVWWFCLAACPWPPARALSPQLLRVAQTLRIDKFVHLWEMAELRNISIAASSGNEGMTIFAPSDEFVPDAVMNVFVANTALKDFLLHHIVQGEVDMNNMPSSLTSLAGSPLRITRSADQLFVNGAPLSESHSRLPSNTVIHVIKGLLCCNESFALNAAKSHTLTELLPSVHAATFRSLLKVADCDVSLEMPGVYTVLVPTDAAFAQLDPTFLNNLKADNERLRSVLLYHIIPGRFPLSEIVKQQRLITKTGNIILPNIIYKGNQSIVTLAGAQILRSDIEAKNGIVHVIDKVIVDVPEGNTWTTLKNNPKFSQLVDILESYNLSHIFTGKTTFTFFAPTNNALVHFAEEEQTGPGLLQYIMIGPHYKGSLKRWNTLTTIGGTLLPVKAENDTLTIGGCKLTNDEIMTRNGVIQPIDCTMRYHSPQETTPLPETTIGHVTTVIEIIQGILQRLVPLRTLVTSLLVTKLGQDLKQRGPFTVFAPTDSAFKELSPSLFVMLIKNKTFVTELLYNHVVPGLYTCADLNKTNTLTSIRGQVYQLQPFKDCPLVNGATITTPNVTASNGIVHVIDKLLWTGTEIAGVPPKMDIAQKLKSLDATIMATLLEKAGLMPLLKQSKYTVLGPVDEAWEQLPVTVTELEQDMSSLRDLLLFHLLPGMAPASNMTDNEALNTSLGISVTTRIYYTPYEQEIVVGGAQVMHPDEPYKNGIIHIVDKVMYPLPQGDVITTLALSKDPVQNMIAILYSNIDLIPDTPFTLFCPLDDAFKELQPPLEDLLQNDSPLLKRILLNHIIKGVHYTQEYSNTTNLKTLGGQTVSFSVIHDQIWTNGVPVTTGNILSINAVIHLVPHFVVTIIEVPANATEGTVMTTVSVEETSSYTTVTEQEGTATESPDVNATTSAEVATETKPSREPKEFTAEAPFNVTEPAENITEITTEEFTTEEIATVTGNVTGYYPTPTNETTYAIAENTTTEYTGIETNETESTVGTTVTETTVYANVTEFANETLVEETATSESRGFEVNVSTPAYTTMPFNKTGRIQPGASVEGKPPIDKEESGEVSSKPQYFTEAENATGISEETATEPVTITGLTTEEYPYTNETELNATIAESVSTLIPCNETANETCLIPETTTEFHELTTTETGISNETLETSSEVSGTFQETETTSAENVTLVTEFATVYIKGIEFEMNETSTMFTEENVTQVTELSSEKISTESSREPKTYTGETEPVTSNITEITTETAISNITEIIAETVTSNITEITTEPVTSNATEITEESVPYENITEEVTQTGVTSETTESEPANQTEAIAPLYPEGEVSVTSVPETTMSSTSVQEGLVTESVTTGIVEEETSTASEEFTGSTTEVPSTTEEINITEVIDFRKMTNESGRDLKYFTTPSFENATEYTESVNGTESTLITTGLSYITEFIKTTTETITGLFETSSTEETPITETNVTTEYAVTEVSTATTEEPPEKPDRAEADVNATESSEEETTGTAIYSTGLYATEEEETTETTEYPTANETTREPKEYVNYTESPTTTEYENITTELVLGNETSPAVTYSEEPHSESTLEKEVTAVTEVTFQQNVSESVTEGPNVTQYANVTEQPEMSSTGKTELSNVTVELDITTQETITYFANYTNVTTEREPKAYTSTENITDITTESEPVDISVSDITTEHMLTNVTAKTSFDNVTTETGPDEFSDKMLNVTGTSTEGEIIYVTTETPYDNVTTEREPKEYTGDIANITGTTEKDELTSVTISPDNATFTEDLLNITETTDGEITFVTVESTYDNVTTESEPKDYTGDLTNVTESRELNYTTEEPGFDNVTKFTEELFNVTGTTVSEIFSITAETEYDNVTNVTTEREPKEYTGDILNVTEITRIEDLTSVTEETSFDNVTETLLNVSGTTVSEIVTITTETEYDNFTNVTTERQPKDFTGDLINVTETTGDEELTSVTEETSLDNVTETLLNVTGTTVSEIVSITAETEYDNVTNVTSEREPKEFTDDVFNITVTTPTENLTYATDFDNVTVTEELLNVTATTESELTSVTAEVSYDNVTNATTEREPKEYTGEVTNVTDTTTEEEFTPVTEETTLDNVTRELLNVTETEITSVTPETEYDNVTNVTTEREPKDYTDGIVNVTETTEKEELTSVTGEIDFGNQTTFTEELFNLTGTTESDIISVTDEITYDKVTTEREPKEYTGEITNVTDTTTEEEFTSVTEITGLDNVTFTGEMLNITRTPESEVTFITTETTYDNVTAETESKNYTGDLLNVTASTAEEELTYVTEETRFQNVTLVTGEFLNVTGTTTESEITEVTTEVAYDNVTTEREPKAYTGDTVNITNTTETDEITYFTVSDNITITYESLNFTGSTESATTYTAIVTTFDNITTETEPTNYTGDLLNVTKSTAKEDQTYVTEVTSSDNVTFTEESVNATGTTESEISPVTTEITYDNVTDETTEREPKDYTGDVSNITETTPTENLTYSTDFANVTVTEELLNLTATTESEISSDTDQITYDNVTTEREPKDYTDDVYNITETTPIENLTYATGFDNVTVAEEVLNVTTTPESEITSDTDEITYDNVTTEREPKEYTGDILNITETTELTSVTEETSFDNVTSTDAMFNITGTTEGEITSVTAEITYDNVTNATTDREPKEYTGDIVNITDTTAKEELTSVTDETGLDNATTFTEELTNVTVITASTIISVTAKTEYDNVTNVTTEREPKDYTGDIVNVTETTGIKELTSVTEEPSLDNVTKSTDELFNVTGTTESEKTSVTTEIYENATTEREPKDYTGDLLNVTESTELTYATKEPGFENVTQFTEELLNVTGTTGSEISSVTVEITYDNVTNVTTEREPKDYTGDLLNVTESTELTYATKEPGFENVTQFTKELLNVTGTTESEISSVTVETTYDNVTNVTTERVPKEYTGDILNITETITEEDLTSVTEETTFDNVTSTDELLNVTGTTESGIVYITSEILYGNETTDREFKNYTGDLLNVTKTAAEEELTYVTEETRFENVTTFTEVGLTTESIMANVTDQTTYENVTTAREPKEFTDDLSNVTETTTEETYTTEETSFDNVTAIPGVSEETVNMTDITTEIYVTEKTVYDNVTETKPQEFTDLANVTQAPTETNVTGITTEPEFSTTESGITTASELTGITDVFNVTETEGEVTYFDNVTTYRQPKEFTGFSNVTEVTEEEITYVTAETFYVNATNVTSGREVTEVTVELGNVTETTTESELTYPELDNATLFTAETELPEVTDLFNMTEIPYDNVTTERVPKEFTGDLVYDNATESTVEEITHMTTESIYDNVTTESASEDLEYTNATETVEDLEGSTTVHSVSTEQPVTIIKEQEYGNATETPTKDKVTVTAETVYYNITPITEREPKEYTGVNETTVTVEVGAPVTTENITELSTLEEIDLRDHTTKSVTDIEKATKVTVVEETATSPIEGSTSVTGADEESMPTDIRNFTEVYSPGVITELVTTEKVTTEFPPESTTVFADIFSSSTTTLPKVNETLPVNTLLQLLNTTGLTENITHGGPITIFAPTDSAFSALNNKTLDDLIRESNMTEVLLFHCAPIRISMKDLARLIKTPTLSGQPLFINTYKQRGVTKIQVNGAAVSPVEYKSGNNTVFLIGQVLRPPMGDLMDVVESQPDTSTLLTNMMENDLYKLLQGAGPYTLFAPNEDAWKKLSLKQVIAFTQKPELLREFLLGHIVRGAIFSSSLTPGNRFTSVNGKPIIIRLQNGVTYVNNARVKQTDVSATNGVIHILESILEFPESTDIDTIGSHYPTSAPSYWRPSADKMEGAVNGMNAIGVVEFTRLLPTVEFVQILRPLRFYTIFAPSDDSLRKMEPDLAAMRQSNPSELRHIVRFHIIDHLIHSKNFTNGSLPTLGGRVNVVIRPNGQVLVNGAKIVRKDQSIPGGIVHIIDNVLVHPDQSLKDTIKTDFPYLYDAFISMGKLPSLEAKPFTFFAPSEDAWKNYEKRTEDIIYFGQERPQEYLKNHICIPRLSSYILGDGLSCRTLSGRYLYFTKRDNNKFVNGSHLLKMDIGVQNGVVHIMDDVFDDRRTTSYDFDGDRHAAGSNRATTSVLPYTKLYIPVVRPNPDGTAVITNPPSGTNFVKPELSNDGFIEKPLLTLTTNTFDRMLKTAEMDQLIDRPDYTILAPTDSAFEDASLPRDITENPQNLRKLLSFHILPQKLNTNILELGLDTPTLANHTVRVSSDGRSAFANNALVLGKQDRQDSKNQVYILDKVLVPPNLQYLSTAIQNDDNLFVLNHLIRGANFPRIFEENRMLNDVIGTNQWMMFLNEKGPYTLFLPTDSAFNAVKSNQLNSIRKDQDALRDFVMDHTVAGSYLLSSSVPENLTVITLSGKKLLITKGKDGIKINNATITKANITRFNGVIHHVDKIINGLQTAQPVQEMPSTSLVEPQVQLMDLLEMLNLTLFRRFVNVTGLQKQLTSQSQLTILAPTDQAFQSLPHFQDLSTDLNKLHNLLTYHIIPEPIPTTFMEDEMTQQTLAPQKNVRFNSYWHKDTKKWLSSGSPIILPDNLAQNGVIHVLQQPMFVPLGNLLETLHKSAILQTFKKAVQSIAMDDTLTEQGPYTIFAPTDEAFQQLSPGVQLRLLQEPEMLTNLTRRHIVSGTHYAAALFNRTQLTSIGGSVISIRALADCFLINKATIMYPDVSANNGVIHVINQVL